MKTPRTKRRARITKAVSMDTDLARWSEQQAEKENRPWSNFVETLLQKHRAAREAEKREAVA